MTKEWNVTFKVYRKKTGHDVEYKKYPIQIHPDEYVLDGVEKVWAFHDRTLIYRHACHHSACGACGMRVNGVEKLTCITTIRSVTRDGGTITVEPLRNFPVISDLAVDMGQFFRNLDQADYTQVQPIDQLPSGKEIHPDRKQSNEESRLVDCIECGLCVSACPICATTETYLGPATLSAVQPQTTGKPELMRLADCADGVWRCHSAFECSEVCPSFVEPGSRIMDLRKQVMIKRIKDFFSQAEKEGLK